jgi:hypothetical protein
VALTRWLVAAGASVVVVCADCMASPVGVMFCLVLMG